MKKCSPPSAPQITNNTNDVAEFMSSQYVLTTTTQIQRQN